MEYREYGLRELYSFYKRALSKVPRITLACGGRIITVNISVCNLKFKPIGGHKGFEICLGGKEYIVAPGRLILVLFLNPYKCCLMRYKLRSDVSQYRCFFPRVESDLNRGDVQHNHILEQKGLFS